MNDTFNMTMRKFLKQVGVTSQKAIEDAVRAAGPAQTAGRRLTVRAVVSIGELGMEHVVEGEIVIDDQSSEDRS